MIASGAGGVEDQIFNIRKYDLKKLAMRISNIFPKSVFMRHPVTMFSRLKHNDNRTPV